MTIEMLDVRGERLPRSRPPGTLRLSEAVGRGQPVEKLPPCPLRPQNGPLTHRIWGFLELLEPDS